MRPWVVFCAAWPYSTRSPALSCRPLATCWRYNKTSFRSFSWTPSGRIQAWPFGPELVQLPTTLPLNRGPVISGALCGGGGGLIATAGFGAGPPGNAGKSSSLKPPGALLTSDGRHSSAFVLRPAAASFSAAAWRSRSSRCRCRSSSALRASSSGSNSSPESGSNNFWTARVRPSSPSGSSARPAVCGAATARRSRRASWCCRCRSSRPRFSASRSPRVPRFARRSQIWGLLRLAACRRPRAQRGSLAAVRSERNRSEDLVKRLTRRSSAKPGGPLPALAG